METHAQETLDLFESCLAQLESRISDFVVTPGKDFTRHRVLDVRTIVQLLLSFEGKTLNNEVIDFFIDANRISSRIPSVSAFVQQRSKLKYEAFYHLFRLFQKEPSEDQLFKGFRLLAVDGTGLNIAGNKNDPESRHSGIGGKEPFNEIYIHALFDILQNSYVDLSIAKLHKNNEPRVFVDMLQRFASPLPAIFFGDANYGTFNIMAHIQNIHQKFLFRTKDVTSNGAASSFLLPDSETFDICLPDLMLTRLCSEARNEDKNRVHYLTRDSVFDFLSTRTKENESQYFHLPLRIVRFPIAEGKCETIFTNLDPIAFPLPLIKKLYSLRWGIETSFRRLKHTIGLLYTHSKKADFLYQEIFAKAILYNFVSFCSASVLRQKGKKGYFYTVNFSIAVNLCKKFLLNTINLLKLEENIFRCMNPIRPSKSFERKKHQRAFKSFMYRLA